MSINGNKTSTFAGIFGQTPATTPTQEEREKSQVWLNIGLEAGGDENGEGARFVSLPVGVPLDTQKPIAVRGTNEDFNAFTGARNDLLEQLQMLAADLEPGEERIIGLQVQMRRIAAPTEAAPVDDGNKYRIKLALPNG